MFENLSTLQLVILLGTGIGIFVFLLFLLIPGKDEKESKKFKSAIPTSKSAPLPAGIEENDRSVLVAIISEKIDHLSKKLEDYTEVMKRIEALLNRLEVSRTSAGDKEGMMKLTERVSLLEEKMAKSVAEKTKINELKDRLNEVVTILKTLGS